MIKLGINTMVWTCGFTVADLPLLSRIRDYGYDTVEIAVFDFDATDPVPIRRAAADTGLDLTVTSALPAGMSLVTEDHAVRTRTREWLWRAIERVAEFGGSILAGPLYSPVGELPGRRRTKTEWSFAIDEYCYLADSIRGLGVRLAIEPLNRFETYFLNTAADARRLCDEVGSDAIGVLFDTFHANIEEDDIVCGLRSLGARLFHIHLSENHRGVPGDGHIEFVEVLEALRKAGYNGHAVVESFASTIPELACATAIWRDYAESPDVFARTAAAHLRSILAMR